jgi:hypothetical protein
MDTVCPGLLDDADASTAFSFFAEYTLAVEGLPCHVVVALDGIQIALDDNTHTKFLRIVLPNTFRYDSRQSHATQGLHAVVHIDDGKRLWYCCCTTATTACDAAAAACAACAAAAAAALRVMLVLLYMYCCYYYCICTAATTALHVILIRVPLHVILMPTLRPHSITCLLHACYTLATCLLHACYMLATCLLHALLHALLPTLPRLHDPLRRATALQQVPAPEMSCGPWAASITGCISTGTGFKTHSVGCGNRPTVI